MNNQSCATTQEDIHADFHAVAVLQKVIERDKGLDAVIAAKREAIDEIERTVARYLKELHI